MKSLSWEERGIRVDGRFLSNLHFADDIILFSSSTSEADTMLNEMNEAGKTIGVRINRKKTQFMKNAYCEDGGGQLEGSQIMETLSYVYLGRSVNMKNDLKEELNRRMRAAFEILERCLLKFNRRTQHLVGLRSSERLNGLNVRLKPDFSLSVVFPSLAFTDQRKIILVLLIQ
ncbi:hypothetical protein RB195_019725 [Necator americanus]|uniref:Reverse transcriptase domain-containing protein n=1 Tax=Necator americanus TaxID=51031 RepID=A0ABR1CHG4_NECAM